MRVFTTKVFRESIKKQRVTKTELKAVAFEFRKGSKGDEIRKSFFKKRMKSSTTGKSGGYRTYLAHQVGDNLFFVLAQERKSANKKGKQSKNQKKSLKQTSAKLSEEQIDALAVYGQGYFNLEDEQIDELLEQGVLEELVLPAEKE